MTITMTMEEYKAIAKTMDPNSILEIPSFDEKKMGKDENYILVSTSANSITETVSENIVLDAVKLNCIQTLLKEFNAMMDDMTNDPEAKSELKEFAKKFELHN